MSKNQRSVSASELKGVAPLLRGIRDSHSDDFFHGSWAAFLRTGSSRASLLLPAIMKAIGNVYIRNVPWWRKPFW